MSKIFNAVLLFYFCFFLQYKLFATPENTTRVQAYHTTEKITIDGKLTESVWQNNPIEDFTQRDPKEGDKPTEKSYVWFAYDESYFYCSAKLNDSHPDSIHGRLARRDDMEDSDWFGIAIDSYHDRRTAFYFVVNPAGSIEDGLYYNDSWSDDSWDGIWDCASSIDSEGWNVEMKIPFSQLRFNKAEEMVWGINIARKIVRKNEEDHFVMVPKKESGYVSHFAQLVGLKGIEPKQRVEVLPYLVQKAQYLVHDINDPFYKSNQYRTMLGADIKLGLGSNLTLDATINPDFGQVEVDPAVVNLSAFETYFEEKRPFFIEGLNIFNFGTNGANSNWNFNWGNPEFFYSRRIGRTPEGDAGENDYVNFPTETRILGAAKVSGKIGDTWSFGAVDAVTERTFAKTDLLGNRAEVEVEPLTNYGILRVQNEFNSGKQSLGFIVTSVNRDLQSPELKNNLSKQAYAFGVDGWSFLDSSETYVLTGYAAGTYVQGSKDYLIKLQEAPLRYMQRPDARYAKLDSNRTSLSGFITRFALNKQKGNFYINSGIGVVSPGFESNDAGFQWRANTINSHLVIGYKWFEPDNIFRNKNVFVSHARNYDFDGNIENNFWGLFTNVQFLNYYGFSLQMFYGLENFSSRLTRGGPLAKNPPGYELSFNGYSDSRKPIVSEVFGYYSGDDFGSKYFNAGLNIEWKPTSALNITIGPSMDRNLEKVQWVTEIDDPVATATYGKRYIFAEMNQKTVAGNIRVNWTFTPKLTLQLYLQPLVSVGDYKNFKQLAKPKTKEYNVFEKNGATINYNKDTEEYTIDPDGSGSAANFSFNNPNFNFKSIRANLVLRWEFLPGSAFYFVWQNFKENYDNPGEFSFRRDFNNLFKSQPNNIYLVKFTYWLDV
ncbi:MAG: DUF5916 domain-containing protein [Ignavibacteriales bacterium]|nr:DUF5916 domain-containing protein [Ignavibacteriales bacterium]